MVAAPIVLASHLLYRTALVILSKVIGVYPSYPFDRAMVLFTTLIVWLSVLPFGVMDHASASSTSNMVLVLFSSLGGSLVLDRLDTYLSVATDEAKISVITNHNNRR